MVVVPRDVHSKDKVIRSHESLRAVLRGLQSQGKTVVLTNGVFDLVHVGHMRCLEDARARGDFLVVAVNSDKAAAELKGKGHPIFPQEERMELLSGFWFVDYVTGFEEPTAEEILSSLRPDVYAKGTEYNMRTLPERAVVKELRIQTVFSGDKKGHSTTKTIQRIRKRKFS